MLYMLFWTMSICSPQSNAPISIKYIKEIVHNWKRKLLLDLLILMPHSVYMTVFFKMNAIGVILKRQWMGGGGGGGGKCLLKWSVCLFMNNIHI